MEEIEHLLDIIYAEAHKAKLIELRNRLYEWAHSEKDPEIVPIPWEAIGRLNVMEKYDILDSPYLTFVENELLTNN